MNEDNKRSILQMARGAIMERVDYEMARVLANITDANTSPTAKRKLTVTLELAPDSDRQMISVKCTAKSALAPTNPVVTALYVSDKDNVVEMVPQIPGQYDMDGEIQEAPAQLKLIKIS